MSFDLDAAIKIANQAVCAKEQRNLTDVEIIVLKGAWQREEYDNIAAKNQYAASYISQDVAPKLWRLLTLALGEKVKKNNFKEALKRCWEKQLVPKEISSDRATIDKDSQLNVAEKSLISDLNQEKDSEPSNNFSQEKRSPWLPDFYVERPPIESICYETLLQPGSLLRIKAPKLMGKTTLITGVLAQLAQEGYRTINLSFELADRKTHFTNLNKFLRWFCLNLSRELKLPSQLDDYWDEEGMGSKVSCTTYFEEYLLVSTDSPLILCLDDVDVLFPYPEIYEDFFGLLRSWYEKARSRQHWKKLRLAIVHATDVYISLNINQSPFNVGLPIELPEFTCQQVRNLAGKYRLEIDTAIIDSLIELVGGHPYLLEQAFAHLKSYPDITPNLLLTKATTEAGIYRHHLQEYCLNLQEHPELALAFKKVVISDKPVQLEPRSAYQLQSMGLVKLSGNEVEPRCNLYRQYFCDRLEDNSDRVLSTAVYLL
jgi:AAA-like domain